MFMLVNNWPYISCANYVEMWVLDEKTFIFVKSESYSRPIEAKQRKILFEWSSPLIQKEWSAAWFNYILIALILAYNRNKLFKTLCYWSRDMLIFDFLDKVLGIVSLAHVVYDFSTKMFCML